MSDYPIGYIYRADKYCPTCIVEVANLYASVGGLDPADTETRLDYCASQLGLDRSAPFDSGDFPAPFVGTPHDGCSLANGYEPGQCGDACGGCGEHLGHDCPNVADPGEVEDYGRYASGGKYARDFDPATAASDGRAVIRDEIRMAWDDAWGSALSNLGGLCDVLHVIGGDIPADAGYSPGCGGPAMLDYPAERFADMYAFGEADIADFEYWARVMSRFVDLVPEDRRY